MCDDNCQLEALFLTVPRRVRLIVDGKGNKERAVFLTQGAKCAIDDWIRIRDQGKSNALLLQVNKGGLATTPCVCAKMRSATSPRGFQRLRRNPLPPAT